MENTRGAMLMLVAMAGFAIEDAFIKAAAADLPTGQILAILGLAGTVIFSGMAMMRGQNLFSRDFFGRAVMLRNLGEVIGTMGYVTAIILTPLSSASAILQAMPLVVTMGAALFLGQRVGWRRGVAILTGLGGVLLIIRPGFEGFLPASIFAVVGVLGLALRDVTTRAVPRHVPTLVLSSWSFAMIVPLGLGMLAASGGARMPQPETFSLLLGAVAAGVGAYLAVTAALRLGDIAFVAPFRYSRLVFALAIGLVFFDEHPDTLTLVGSAIVIGSGLYAFWRERALSLRTARG